MVGVRACANEKISKSGTVVREAAGYPVKSPFVTVANTACEQLTRMVIEFGMTPSSRSRVTVAKAGDTSPYSKFVKRT